MTTAIRTAAIRNSRPHCTCAEVRNYGYTAAAAKLGCKPRFLEDRISKLPHQKLGGSVVFCDCELRIVQRMFTVIPEEVWREVLGLETELTPKPEAPASLYSIKPAGAQRPAAAAVR